MTYSDKLRDPRWQKKRLEILQRDCWKCLSCGASDKELQVHHVIYKRRDPWDYPDDVYQTLCKDCYGERLELTDLSVDSLRILLKDVPTKRIAEVSTLIQKKALEVTKE